MNDTRGRTESNDRLFGEETVWCVELIRALRSLGFTIKEIQEMISWYVAHPNEPIGPRLGCKLELVLSRIEVRVVEQQLLRQHIRDFQSAHAAALAGRTELSLLTSDPRRGNLPQTPGLSPPGEGVACATSHKIHQG
jgi:MerR family copper efflux transcriptional regulator